MERRTWLKAAVAAGAVAGLGTVGWGTLRQRSPGIADASAAPAPEPPLIHVHKDPSCGCCGQWVEHLRSNGFRVVVSESSDMGAVKARLGVPFGKGSCHTGEVEGYLVEGHVPARDIQRLLAERPQARGLVLPGMPIGSPGMEIPGAPVQPFVVELVKMDGETEAYSRHVPALVPAAGQAAPG